MSTPSIRDITDAACHRWPDILAALSITVPPHNRHGPCPVCGGKDRFRFDDLEGRGTWFCNRCSPQAGNGLDLVARVLNCDIQQAANRIAPLVCTPPPPQTQPRNKARTQDIQNRVHQLLKHCQPGQSPYLSAKGLFHQALLLSGTCSDYSGVHISDGSLVLPFKDIQGQVTGAQLISPDGEKRFLRGSSTKGAFIEITAPQNKPPQRIIITEGFATGVAVSTFTFGLVVAATSVSNLVTAAQALRQRYPNTPLILAGDNDAGQNANIGKMYAEKAALAADGFVTLPPTQDEADWDDYLRSHGKEKAAQAFEQSLYRPGTPTPPAPINNLTPMPAALKIELLPVRRSSEGYDTQQNYIIKDYLPYNALACVYGPSGSFKSFHAIAWACHIACGRPWANKPVTQGVVIYIAAEGGVGVARRIKAWENRYHGKAQLEHFYRIDCPIFPASPESLMQVIQAIDAILAGSQKPLRLIVLDTLARCFGGSDENTAKDMGAFIQGCDSLKARYDATLLVVHHSGKDQEKGARGSSAFRAALDTEYLIKREGDNNALILACTKMKDAEEPRKAAYDLAEEALYHDSDNELISSLVLIDKPRAPQEHGVDKFPEFKRSGHVSENHIVVWECIQSCIEQGLECTKSQLRHMLKDRNVPSVDKKFTRWLSKLEKDGFIRVEGEIISVLVSPTLSNVEFDDWNSC